jgi:hypothetical protein
MPDEANLSLNIKVGNEYRFHCSPYLAAKAVIGNVVVDIKIGQRTCTNLNLDSSLRQSIR